MLLQQNMIGGQHCKQQLKAVTLLSSNDCVRQELNNISVPHVPHTFVKNEVYCTNHSDPVAFSSDGMLVASASRVQHSQALGHGDKIITTDL